ncbi:tryptophan--tRNA ligase [Streptomyces sp. H10-C2]|uniref:tryptophan--tRNA ligase n=1 Tax=unclassified Streptomyces TaxID=2593676 RepID=UPI0024BA1643|nr:MULTISPECIES: tryptophan--tRNA ligase [unclassified Streptomyces]MDJ0345301.1 tryptophan--tRNA ligase [Streptomyces sp. PH10-H1]MDJ0374260.1 tryptophan--tRNA ligase [Streptomyces sp. H10-C2]
MTRIFSGVTPSGHLTLGNYLGAIQRWVAVDQHRSPHQGDALFSIVDLHALTVEHEPARVRRLTRQTATILLAAGLDPQVCTVFVQSHVDEHTRLSYVLECTATDGELRRMIQYKEKSARQQTVRLSLLTYPVLMTADILAYRTDEVPVGDDQAQHVELARDLAIRFNQRYGLTFTVPRAVLPPVAARVMDLQNPASKMSKSASVTTGIISLLDEPEVIRKKVMRAVTDSGTDVEYDRAEQPGLANLLEILAACTGKEPGTLAGEYDSYGAVKKDTAEAVIELVRPLRERHSALCADPSYVDGVLREGAERARALARPTVDAAYRAIGLL